MGGALLEGWMAAGVFSHVTVVTPEKHTVDSFLRRYENVTQVDSPEQLDSIADVLILGVKPQIMPKVIGEYAEKITKDTLVITMAAGLDLSFYEKALGGDKQIVRLMPNTPATISKAMCGLLANANVTPSHKDLATKVTNAVGKSLWVENDERLDRLTAISGCGPAYVFAMVEALIKAGEALGFCTEDATLLVRETVIGSAQYLSQTAHKSAKDLRVQVTSPGGMTAEGVAVLQKDNALDCLMEEAALAAFNRAADLKA